MSQPALFQQSPKFDGPLLTDSDQVRLTGQMAKVLEFMQPGHWWTLHQISLVVGAPEQSVSARIRDLRKQKFGGHTVERQHLGNGLYQYRLKVAHG